MDNLAEMVKLPEGARVGIGDGVKVGIGVIVFVAATLVTCLAAFTKIKHNARQISRITNTITPIFESLFPILVIINGFFYGSVYGSNLFFYYE